MRTNSKNSLTVKDLVTTGIFSALFLVFALVGGIFFAPNPVLTFYMPIGSALLCGPVLSSAAGQGAEARGGDYPRRDTLRRLVRHGDALGHGAGLSCHGHRRGPHGRNRWL